MPDIRLTPSTRPSRQGVVAPKIRPPSTSQPNQRNMHSHPIGKRGRCLGGGGSAAFGESPQAGTCLVGTSPSPNDTRLCRRATRK